MLYTRSGNGGIGLLLHDLHLLKVYWSFGVCPVREEGRLVIEVPTILFTGSEGKKKLNRVDTDKGERVEVDHCLK